MPLAGLVSPNYHVNVEHAFASSSNLVAVARQYAGRRYFVAHSLGNMLVSSAIQDWNLPHDKYMVLNAAVPIEAYDTSSDAVNETTANRLMPRDWVGYDASLRAANWHGLFDPGDGRRKLTWKGRFSRVVNTVNYYSSEEEVLRCGNGEWRQPLQRAYSWYNQERIKGVKPVEAGLGRNEGGWGFNTDYYVEDEYEDDNNQTVRYISFAVGGNPVSCWESEGDDNEQAGHAVQNVNMIGLKDAQMIDVLSSDPDADERRWKHVFFLSKPYCVVHNLFENIVDRLNSAGGDQ